MFALKRVIRRMLRFIVVSVAPQARKCSALDGPSIISLIPTYTCARDPMMINSSHRQKQSVTVVNQSVSIYMPKRNKSTGCCDKKASTSGAARSNPAFVKQFRGPSDTEDAMH
jgi:hypothetical protein